MAAGGRPSKFTPEIKKKLLDAIRAGNYYEPACAYAGIDYSTFRNWMKKGEKAKKGEFLEFFQEVRQAEAEAEARMVLLWQKQMPENWPAIRDFLERRYPERWGRRSVDVSMKQEVNGQVNVKHDGSITFDLAKDEGFLRAIQEAITGRAATGDMDSLSGPLDQGEDTRTSLEETSRNSESFGCQSEGSGC